MASSKKFRKNYNNSRSSSKNAFDSSAVLPSAVLDEFDPSRQLDKNPAGFFAEFSHRDFPYQNFYILAVEKVTVSGPHWHHEIYIWLQCGQLCVPYEYDYLDDEPHADQSHWRPYTFENANVLGIRVLATQNKTDALGETDMSNLYYYMQANNLVPYVWAATTTSDKYMTEGNFDLLFAQLPSKGGSHRKADYKRAQRIMYSLAGEKVSEFIQKAPTPEVDPSEPVLFGPTGDLAPDTGLTPEGLLTDVQYGVQIDPAKIFEWYSGQFPDTPNAHMVFFDGRSFYVPNGTQIHQTLSRLLKPAGYMVCFTTYDMLKVAPLLIPLKNTVAYGKYTEYALPDLEQAKAIASTQFYNLVLRQWGNGWKMDGLVAVVTSKEQMTQIGSFVGSVQDMIPLIDFLKNLMGG